MSDTDLRPRCCLCVRDADTRSQGPPPCSSCCCHRPSAAESIAVAQPNTRSSQLFEAPTTLPLSREQESMVRWLNFFKRWYLAVHAVYILALVMIGATGFFALEPSLPLIDAFFVAMSTVCNCGLQTANVTDWRPASQLLRHVLMIAGGVVFTSVLQPLLRLMILYKVRDVYIERPEDTDRERSQRAARLRYGERLHYTAVLCVLTPLVYFVVVHAIVMMLLVACNCSGLTVLEAAYMTTAAFHSCVFLSMEEYVGDGVVVGLTTIACALGFTAFPVVLRGFLLLEWQMYRLLRKGLGVLARRRGSGTSTTPLLAPDQDTADDSEEDTDLVVDQWDSAFAAVLGSHHPAAFHPFLFLTSESLYLGCAWWMLTIAQAAPFWFQQWHGVLVAHTPVYRMYLSVCQGAVVRFAAASFVPLHEYSNAHIAITILAMYIPALPISTDRTYRKWRQMFRTSIVRLLTSRLFWLFSAMTGMLFAEESSLAAALRGTRFDIMTRTFFEVISAYAGCGLSLSVPGSPVSFTGSTGVFSKLIITGVLFGGRHRFVDLGIDLGFAVLQTDLHGIGGEGVRV